MRKIQGFALFQAEKFRQLAGMRHAQRLPAAEERALDVPRRVIQKQHARRLVPRGGNDVLENLLAGLHQLQAPGDKFRVEEVKKVVLVLDNRKGIVGIIREDVDFLAMRLAALQRFQPGSTSFKSTQLCITRVMYGRSGSSRPIMASIASSRVIRPWSRMSQ